MERHDRRSARRPTRTATRRPRARRVRMACRCLGLVGDWVLLLVHSVLGLSTRPPCWEVRLVLLIYILRKLFVTQDHISYGDV